MATLERAIEIAAKAHAGTLDKQGGPYLLHPMRVMLDVEDPAARIVAALHDVVEDTDVSIEDLRRAGFSEDVLTALKLVTHEEEMAYADYVVRCKTNPLALQVKLADLRDNSRLDRMLLRPSRLNGDIAKIQKYAFSYKYLTDEIDEGTYRELMGRIES